MIPEGWTLSRLAPVLAIHVTGPNNQHCTYYDDEDCVMYQFLDDLLKQTESTSEAQNV